MQRKNIKTDIVTYNALISACEKGQNGEKGLGDLFRRGML